MPACVYLAFVPDTVFRYQGNRRAAKHVATRLIEAGFEVYAYAPRHETMPHAILNTLLLLDWDRRGFDYPIMPFLTNCYGRQLFPLRGRGVNNLAEIPQEGDRKPQKARFVESWLTNANKAFAVFQP